MQGTHRLVMHCRIHRAGTVTETRDDWHIRTNGPWHLEMMPRAIPDWSLEGCYSWRDLSPDIAPEDHYFMVLDRV